MSLDFWLVKEMPVEVYEKNITHNLTSMAEAAGLYKVLWRPDENGYQYARDLIEPLEDGLVNLREGKESLLMHSPKNGWGTYEDLLNFAKECLEACREYPDAEIKTWR